MADASNADMHRAIDAARRAFDETDWSTDRELRNALPLPAAGRAREGARGAARGAHPRGGLPAHDHARQPARHPAGRRAALPDQAHRRVPLADRPARDRRPAGHGEHPPDLEGAGRRRRRHRAVELPARGDAQQARPGPGHRQHRDPQAGARHAVERHPPRPSRRRADRLPGRRPQRRDLLGPPRRRGADAVAEGRPDFVHRIDRGGQADHGEGRRHPQARLPRARRQVGHHRARRRRLRRPRCPRASRCASTPGRAAPFRPACSSPARATRKASRSSGHAVLGGLRGPAAARRPDGTAHLGQAA